MTEHHIDEHKPDETWYPRNFDWYVKWMATVSILISMVFRSAGPEYRLWDLGIGTVGIALWLWVAIMWRDRALIILNSVSVLMLASTFLREI